ncbi:MAG: porin family protein [Candidatus Muirbacterium halophilum]|nr:porin family protein [Candidatus Muirbacterium halophilum]MCK9474385.1 porin family protein [Candidatus Muirbacterium halophilum]
MRKNIFLFFIILILLSKIFAQSAKDPVKETFSYFDKFGLIQTTSQLYNSQLNISSLEKAEIIIEICERLFSKEKKVPLNMNVLQNLKTSIENYSTEILLTGRLDPDEALRKIRQFMLDKRDMQFGYQPSLEKGIYAKEFLKKVQVSQESSDIDGNFIAVDRENIIKSGKIKIKNIIGFDLNKKSYFSLRGGFFEPDSSLPYIKSDYIYGINLGFHRTSRMSFDISSTSYEINDSGNFFGNINDKYSLKINPISFSVRYFLFKLHKILPYGGYGISKVRLKHKLNSIVNEKTFYTPHILYGAEYFEKDRFSIFSELNYYLSKTESLNINGKRYNFDIDKFTIHFGIKFYFNG